jgi:putative IMPACT (imprinted ancient) family translation regulator
MSQKLSLNFWENKKASFEKKILKNIIIDRKSKYTVVWGSIDSEESAKAFIKDILRDSYFRKATHNSFAYRLESENWSIIEVKNDDGETGAGNCILRELQRENLVNTIVVVTRYFGWIQLQSDRFKHVINATKMFIEEM